MENPNLSSVLQQLKELGCAVDLHDVTYYVGRETVAPEKDGKVLARWQDALFAFMERNSAHMSDFLQLPSKQTIEVGRPIRV
jgi:KUP system potassium uptake protein